MAKILQATIEPQAWQNDYANPVDPPGETTWDATPFLSNPPEGIDIDINDVREVIKEDGFWLDRDDILMGDDNAPAWVREWTGPFTITVEEVDEL